MRLIVPEHAHLTEMMSWFSSQEEVEIWSGPNFLYPYSFESFTQDLKLDTLDSFALVANNKTLLGFGQCYARLGYCHLGRLVISPQHRRKHLIGELIQLLSEHGLKKYQTSVSSLFVLEKNLAAISAYEKLGFKVTDYPEQIPIAHCLYMLKTH